jgi:hypothetical protein
MRAGTQEEIYLVGFQSWNVLLAMRTIIGSGWICLKLGLSTGAASVVIVLEWNGKVSIFKIQSKFALHCLCAAQANLEPVAITVDFVM